MNTQPSISMTPKQPTIVLKHAIEQALNALLSKQKPDGHWIYELEADSTIPAEYILMNHFIDEVDDETERYIANYLRSKQNEEGGWPLYHGGKTDISCSIKTYYALKAVGDNINDPHMIRARELILKLGGASQSNVFTRILMALFEQVPWRSVPFIPAEVILFPSWFPFHINKVSYWSRTVMVPLFVLCTLKPKAANPRKINISELFVTPPDQEKNYLKMPDNLLGKLFLVLDFIGKRLEFLIPKAVRQHAIKRCKQWFVARMNEEHGIGGIFPAMANVLECLVVMGHAKDDPIRIQARQAIDALLVKNEMQTYCQPCVSPVWDTCLAAQAVIESTDQTTKETYQALDWLLDKQLHDEAGDWRISNPNLVGGGWAFQYSNYYYPDLDDTAVVGWAMKRTQDKRYDDSIKQAATWLIGMQSDNGGFASFDMNNTYYYLNAIPFADHGALLDPPTADVTARIVAFLSIVDRQFYDQPISRAIKYLKADQESSGAWYGRWGTNYIYGTWSVLTALELAQESSQQDYIQQAVSYLKQIQNEDGGWGESNNSYYPDHHYAPYRSTAFHTAWALLGLLASGEINTTTITDGVEYLLKQQNADYLWSDSDYTCPGFPRVFYLKYHGYTDYFPLWALACYANKNKLS